MIHLEADLLLPLKAGKETGITFQSAIRHLQGNGLIQVIQVLSLKDAGHAAVADHPFQAEASVQNMARTQVDAVIILHFLQHLGNVAKAIHFAIQRDSAGIHRRAFQ